MLLPTPTVHHTSRIHASARGASTFPSKRRAPTASLTKPRKSSGTNDTDAVQNRSSPPYPKPATSTRRLTNGPLHPIRRHESCCATSDEAISFLTPEYTSDRTASMVAGAAGPPAACRGDNPSTKSLNASLSARA